MARSPNQSGKWFNAVQYGVRRDDLRIDYDQAQALATQHRPKLVIAGGSAIPRQVDFARMREIADSVGAWLLVDMAHFAGLVAAGAPVAVPARARGHDDHAQDPARPARRHDPDR